VPESLRSQESYPLSNSESNQQSNQNIRRQHWWFSGKILVFQNYQNPRQNELNPKKAPTDKMLKGDNKQFY
jgi:hypothetical protein